MQYDGESLSPASTIDPSYTDSESDAFLQEKDVTSLSLLHQTPMSFLHHWEILTRSVEEWYLGVTENQTVLRDWFVVKVDHMKNFQYSAVSHEHLRVTLRLDAAARKNVNAQDEQVEPPVNECIIYVEREVKDDEVTVGCQPPKAQKQYKWWIVRLFQGNYSETGGGGGFKYTASLSSTPKWRELGYSTSILLRCLEFREEIISLWEFATVVDNLSNDSPDYRVRTTNCFWFASKLYTLLKEYRSNGYRETETKYVKHMGKFLGLKIYLREESEKKSRRKRSRKSDGRLQREARALEAGEDTPDVWFEKGDIEEME